MLRSLFHTLSFATALAWGGHALASPTLETHRLSGVTDASSATGLSAEALTSGVVFGQAVSYADADAGNIRFNLAAGTTAFETSEQDTHGAENVDVIAFTGDPTSLGITGETGKTTVTATDRNHHFLLSFSRTYTKPVLFLQVAGTGGGAVSAQPITVGSTSAVFSLTEPEAYDGAHTNTVHWAVFEAGRYSLADGRYVEVGARDTTTRTYEIADGPRVYPGVGTKPFSSTAALIAQVQRTAGDVYQGVRVMRYDSGGLFGGMRLRHMRERAVEDAASPEATAGPIGYLVVGSLGLAVITAIPSDPYQVDDEATSMQPMLPENVYEALGGDASAGTAEISLSSARDSLAVVRISAVALKTSSGTYLGLNDPENDIVATATEVDDPETILRIDFNDGTSMFSFGTARYAMLASSGGGGGIAMADMDIGRNERFRVISNDDGTVSLQSWRGYYVIATAAGAVNANCLRLWSTNRFTLVDLGAVTVDALPSMRTQYADMDGDGDEELILIAEQQDGTGYLVMDPLGIADTLYKAGYEPSDDFFDTLSATQQAGLRQQTSDVMIWTGWQSRTDPDNGTGDYETREAHYLAGNIPCEWPDDVKARAVFSTQMGTFYMDAEDTGQDIVLNEVDGLTCVNTEQSGGWCANYQVRFGCSVGALDSITGATLKQLLDDLDESGEARQYASFEFEYILEGSGWSASVEEGIFGATVTVGDYNLMVEYDEFGPGFELSGSLVEVEGKVGGVVSVSVSMGTYSAVWDVDSNGFTVGGGVELVSVKVGVGDEDGSYAAVGASVGVGFYFDLKAGKNDQYGFTVDLPIFPISVALYVKGQDVVGVCEQIEDWALVAGQDVGAFAGDAWSLSSTWVVNAGDDVVVCLSDTSNDAAAAVGVAGTTVVVFVEDATQSAVAFLDDTGSTLEDGLSAVGQGIETGFSTGVDWVSDELEDLGEAILGGFESLFDWAF